MKNNPVNKKKIISLIVILIVFFLMFVSVPRYISNSGGACILLPVPYKIVLGLPWKPTICGYNGIIWGPSVWESMSYWKCITDEQGFCFLFGSCSNTSCRANQTSKNVYKTDILKIQKFVSEGCTSYFDGCNTCNKYKDGFSCTIMWCSIMNEPKCLSYTEKIITTPKGDENNSVYHELNP